MVLFFYNVALLTALVAGAPWWLWRVWRTEKYREGLRDRLGGVPEALKGLAAEGKPAIWLHAVSVGEVLAVSRLVQEIDAAFAGHRLLISTTTRTGQALARQRFGPERVFYCPLDLPWAVRGYLKALRPAMLVLAETEFWPNLLSGCFRRGIPVAVVNARISDRSWPRYQMLRTLWRPLLRRLSRVLAQSAVDAERLVALGCRAERVSVSGNLKFDVRVPGETDATRFLKDQAEGRRFIVAGSTLEGEETALAEAWPKLLAADPELILVVAPRHPDRFKPVLEELKQAGISVVRRSDWPKRWAGAPRLLRSGEVVLLDSIGELASVYSLAAVAFVGGSIAEAGGHNPLEPARFGVPIVMGPHYANFRAITEDLRAHDALRIAGREELAGVLLELLTRTDEARAMGERARRVFEEQAGATGRSIEALREILKVQAESTAVVGAGRA
jgi:3-deoxy-D-manno-octulosonic-acid transferase